MAPFREEVGPTMPLVPTTSVLALFQMFFTTTLMGVIVEQTNIYACHILGVVGLFQVLHPNGDQPPPCHPQLLELGPPTSLRAGGRTHHSGYGSSLFGGSCISPTMVRSHHPTMVRSHHPRQIASGSSAL